MPQSPGQAPQYSGSWVEELNARGFSVCGVDQQGLGFSDGLRGYVERFGDYVADVLQLAKCGLARKARLVRSCFGAEALHFHGILRQGCQTYFPGQPSMLGSR